MTKAKTNQRAAWPRFGLSRRWCGYGLIAVACVYGFLAGFHTIAEKDLGWHMATGRYVLRHHAIPLTDILSYTSPGAPWIYPPFAGVLFYLLHGVAGYAGLSWFCALSMMAIVGCMLRPPSHPECLTTAVLAVVGVPVLAFRMTPRPDLFTHLFFSIFLILLWHFYRESGTAPALMQRRVLWLLPLLMMVWVNLHPGFIAGIAVICGYLVLEAAELADISRRAGALKRLIQIWPMLVATLLATLINPFGLRIYPASLLLSGVQGHSKQTGFSVRELQPMTPSADTISEVLDWRNPGSSFWWLVLAALAAVAVALWRRRFGPAVFLSLAVYLGFQRARYAGLFSIVVTVIGSSILAEFFHSRKSLSRESEPEGRDLHWPAVLVVIAIVLSSCVRSVDLVRSRPFILDSSGECFGAGESSEFPERAADFILRERLPGNIYHPYNLGGFVAFRLGPTYQDFIDGRAVSPDVFAEFGEISRSAVDSTEWHLEAARREINVVLLPTGRSLRQLGDFCRGQLFRPVYLDEVSVVLLRNTQQNRPWLDRLQIDCNSQQFKPPASTSRVTSADFFANAGSTEFFLGRKDEARAALERSKSLTPEDPTVHLALAAVYEDQQEPVLAEEELKATISLCRDSETPWLQLANIYMREKRYSEAQSALETATQLANYPASDFTQLAEIDLALQESDLALKHFGQAETAARAAGEDERENPGMFAAIAAGRATVYATARDWNRAIQYQQEATRDTPGDPNQWQTLANISQAAGKTQLAAQAREKVDALLHQP
jgi:tetratricopeptide (TPR) repeat protein